MSSASGTQPSSTANTSEERLDSWKDVAAYLKRSVPTVQRWEREEQLPVHRLQHKKQGTIYAYKTELDEWWRQRRTALDQPEIQTEEPPLRRDANRQRARVVIAAVGLVLVLGAALAGTVLLRRNRNSAQSGRVMLAVLPFQNLTGEPAQEFVSDGFTEEMISELGRLQQDRLGVIARTSSMSYKHSYKPVDQIARELGVQYVLEGSIRRWGDRVRVTAQLIQTSDQTHLWAENYDSSRQDILRLQSEIARAIAVQIRIALSGAQRAYLDNAPAVDPQVHELCLLGRYEWNKRNDEGLAKAIDYFQQAIARDPTYAPAQADLAEAYLVSAYYGHATPNEMYQKAQAAAERAVRLNDLTFQAHSTLGLVRTAYLQPGAEIEFKRALEINPSYATAHHWYSFYLWRTGRYNEAFAEVERARQLDPVSPIINTDDAVFHLSAGQTDDAIQLLQRTIDLDPLFSEAHRSLAIAYAQQRNFPQAMGEARKALELNPDNIGVRATAGYVAAVSGHREQAKAVLQQLRHGQASNSSLIFQAWLYVGLGQNDQALECLTEEYRRRSPMTTAIALDPIFKPLRQDQRFLALLEHIREEGE
jgi:TolB-like protein/Tfp pilus assembly protein PilF